MAHENGHGVPVETPVGPQEMVALEVPQGLLRLRVPVALLVARRLEVLQRDQNPLRVLDRLRRGVGESREPVTPLRAPHREAERQRERQGAENTCHASHESLPSSIVYAMSQKRY